MKFIKHLNGKSCKEAIDAKWWPNQKEAVAVVAKYFEANTEQQAMISHAHRDRQNSGYRDCSPNSVRTIRRVFGRCPFRVR